MSRIGKQSITIPQGVSVSVANGLVTVTGPQGKLEQQLHSAVSVSQQDGVVTVSVKNPAEKKHRALWGLSQRLISNMVTGVTTGFTKKLEINGVGYKAVVQGKVLVLQVGYSHPVEYKIPEGLTITVEKNVVTIQGADKQLLGQTAAEIRAVRKPEPYKGKGIKYSGEVIRRKVGKAAAKAA